MTEKLAEYQGWWEVPPDLMTQTQLAGLDLPRVPGPQRAWVKAPGWRGKKEWMPLFRVEESPPSPASAVKLRAADGRRKQRGCARCGCAPDRALSDDVPTCLACSRIAFLTDRVARAQEDRVNAVRWAWEVLEVPGIVFVRSWEVLRPPAPSGRQNLEPVAFGVEVADLSGRVVLSELVRLAGPRVRSVPEDAVDLAGVEGRLREVMAAERLVTWGDRPVWALHKLGPERRPGWYGGNPDALAPKARQWRAVVDPDRGELRPALHPGRADRMWLLVRRMADTVL